MSIALPPPATPQQVELAAFDADAARQRSLRFQTYRLHLAGGEAVPLDRVAAALEPAGSLSDAVRALARLYQLAGYPAVRTTYARSGDDLFVRLEPGSIVEVIAPAALQPYFADLPGQTPLTWARLEADRALADGYTERAGERYQPVFVARADGSLALDFGEPQRGRPRTELKADFSDYGNRYSGRYLVDAALRQSFRSGDELKLSGVAGLRALDAGERDAGTYQELALSESRVTPQGVFGVQGSYIRFKQSFNGLRFDGRIQNGGLGWLGLAYADPQRRLTVQARGDYNHERVKLASRPEAAPGALPLLPLLPPPAPAAPPAGTIVLEESYPSAELDFAYTEQDQWREQQFEWNLGVALRKGIDEIGPVLSTANFSYLLLRPNLSFEYFPLRHFSVLLAANGQYTNDVLPQQEQYVIGGPATLHAYAPGVGIGDRGATVQLSVGGRKLRWGELSFEPRVYGDYGLTRFASAGNGFQAAPFRATDIAFELKLDYGGWFNATTSAARPLSSSGPGSGNRVTETFYYFIVGLVL